MGFNWQTEDNSDERWQNENTAEAFPSYGRFLLLGLACLLVAVACYGLWHSLSQRAAEQEKQAIADVEASYHLLALASTTRDLELLRLVLESNDPAWSYEQQAQLLTGQLLERPFTGWVHLPSQDVTSTHIAPTLQQGQVIITQTYQVRGGALPALHLRQTVNFQRGPERWLYTSPTAEQWGAEQTSGGRLLTISYPVRDAAWAALLHPFAEEAIGRYCTLLGPTCPADLQIHLRLSTAPASVPLLFSPNQATFTQLRLGAAAPSLPTLTLPTLSLIGQPTDAASQQALFGQYTAQLLAAINQQWVIGRRMGQVPLDRVLLAEQLRQLGLPSPLRPFPPLQPPFYETLMAYETLWPLVTLPNEELDTPRAAQLVAFLAPLSPFSPLEMQQALGHGSFNKWLETVTGQALWQLERAWAEHVYAQTAAPPPLAAQNYPRQVVSLLCTQSNRDVQYVTLSHWDAPQWSASSTLGNDALYSFAHIPLPADDGFVLQQSPLEPTNNNWFTLLVYGNGNNFHLFDASTWRTPLTYTGVSTPDGRQLVMVAPDPELGFDEFHLLTPEQCTADACALTPSRGLPIWSPTAEYTLLTSFQGLHMGDATGQRLARLERGTFPFWLDAQTYGYLQPLRPTNQRGTLRSEAVITLGRITAAGLDDHPTTLSAADILAAVPPTTLPSALRYRTAQPLLEAVTAHPTNGRLYLLLRLNGQPETYALEYTPATRIARLLFSTTAVPGRFTFSPHGRWLTLTAFEQPALENSTATHQTAHIYAYDLTNPRTYHYHLSLPLGMEPSPWQPDWSADEEWLLLTDEQSAHLIAPLQTYHQRLFHPYLTCGQAAWLNE